MTSNNKPAIFLAFDLAMFVNAVGAVGAAVAVLVGVDVAAHHGVAVGVAAVVAVADGGT